MKQSNIFAAALTISAMLLGAGSALAGDIMVKNAWSRASAGMANAGAAFMEIHNMGKTDDKLVSASSNISAKGELHTHKMDGDIMKMRRVDFIPVAAGGSTELKPGSYHVMFMGLKNKLIEGESFPLTLTFEKAGNVNLTVKVMSPGSMGGMGNMKHGKMEKMGNMNKGQGNKKKMH